MWSEPTMMTQENQTETLPISWVLGRQDWDASTLL